MSRVLRTAMVAMLLALAGGAPPVAAADADRQEWTPIFNGRNLDGWVVKVARHDLGDNYRDTFRVRDGVLQVSYDKYQEFGGRFAHVYYREKLSHYRLSLEYRFVGEMMKDAPDYVRLNSGVMMHSQAPETILKDQTFPISVEAQFLGEVAGTTALRPTMNVCTPATEIFMKGRKVEAHCTNSTSRTYRGDQWVSVEVEVLGNERIRHLTFGQSVLEYEKPEIGGGVVTGFDPAVKVDGTPLRDGYIAVQAEGQPVEFRNVKLLNLSGCMDPKAANYKSYYVHRDDSKCEVSREARAGYPLRSVPFTKVRLQDAFWAARLETNRKVTIPFGFQKSAEEGRLRNFERAAGRLSGGYEGKMPFDDTDVYKLIEGASYSLQSHPDPELERFLDGIIATIGAAQEPDGYLTTYKTIDPAKSPASWLKPGPKWDLELQGSHELYNAGHLYEAAYAHYRATGKRTLLDVALENADLVDRTFGPGKRLTPPGHQIIETGLFKLAEVTGEDRYRKLARFFLDQRGNTDGHKLHGPYNQDHLPVVEQRAAVGHAVRAAYMYAAMVDVAALQDDPLYAAANERIWEDVVSRKLYLTGGIGARHDGEAFGDEFELPNPTAYAETCASIASVYWNQRLFLKSGDAKYVDVLERTLYNAAIAGVSLEGNTFFYPNPLESDGRYDFNNAAATRKPWFSSSCCPTNMARFLPSLPDYVYATRGEAAFVNLFVASRAVFDLAGTPLTLTQKTEYPWDGRVEIAVDPGQSRAFELRVRIPGWARGEPVPSTLYRYLDATPSYAVQVNGRPVEAKLDQGYAVLARTWRQGDVVTLDLPMPVRRVLADSRVKDDEGKVALERGPLVYCVEGADNDGRVLDLSLPDPAKLEAVRRPDLLRGVTVLQGTARGRDGSPRPLVAIPYYAWSHRGEGEMTVWLAR